MRLKKNGANHPSFCFAEFSENIKNLANFSFLSRIICLYKLLIGFFQNNVEQPLQGMALQEKSKTKKKITGYLIKKISFMNGVYSL